MKLNKNLTMCKNNLFRWKDAKRAYPKFINNEIVMRHIKRNPCTLRHTYSYTLI